MAQYYQKQQALGSVVELSIAGDIASAAAEELYRQLWHTVFQFERQFSRFLPASELSQFNRNAGVKQVVSPQFQDILEKAKTIGAETDGLYNPFILPALQAAGYDHSLVKGYEQDTQDDHSHKVVAPVELLEIGEGWARIPYGTAIDLGGCGKGYLADALADMIPTDLHGYWFSLGGDIVARGIDGQGCRWRIGVQSAQHDEEDIGHVMIEESVPLAIATSGITTRKGTKAGKQWHHLIDPQTLKPAETDILLASVCANSAFRVDVLASCAVILGSSKATGFLRQHHVRSGLLQLDKGRAPVCFGNAFIVDAATRGTL